MLSNGNREPREPAVTVPADRSATPELGSTSSTTDTLILDASVRQALVATRSLGSAGHTIALADSHSQAAPRFSAPAFSSRWANSRHLLPDFAPDPDLYAAGVIKLVDLTGAKVVIPCSDQSIGALIPWRKELERRTHFALAPDPALSVANHKLRTLDVAREIGLDVPLTISIESGTDVADIDRALSEMTYPAVVKPELSWVRNAGYSRFVSTAVVDRHEAVAAIEALGAAGLTAYVQPWLSGRREAVNMMTVGGRTVAIFAHVAHRTTPMLGGVTVLRESIPLSPEHEHAATALAEAIGLEGYSEIEFRRDVDGTARLMEINPRLSGGIELAVRAGIDFPRMIRDWAIGVEIPRATGYQIGVRMRWLAGDLRWLVESMRHPKRPDGRSRRSSLALFAHGFTQRSGYDYVDLRDMKPAAAELARLVGRFAPG